MSHNRSLSPSCGPDLVSCELVAYEMRDEVPGIRFAEHGKEQWTPVVSKRRGRTRLKDNDVEDDDLNLKDARQVEYQERDNLPGLYVRRGCTMNSVSWIPIAPSPISSRTRSQTNK